MNFEADESTLRTRLPGQHHRGRGFLAWVVAPTALILLYLLLFAQPQYVSEFRFAVYGPNGGATLRTPGSPGPVGLNGATAAVVADYLQSRQVIEDLKKRFNLAALFKGQGFDPLFHFWWNDGSNEALLAYWRNFVVDVRFDAAGSIGSAAVRAFSPQDALRLSQALLELSERLANEVSTRPQRDAVTFARASLERAEKAANDIFQAVEIARREQIAAGPSRDTDAIALLDANLQSNLAGLTAQAAALRTRLAPTAPALATLHARIAATEQEIARSRAALRAPDAAAAPQDTTQTDAYLQQRSQSALALRDSLERTLEQARFEAEVPHDYLQTHVHPALAQSSVAPKPLLWSALAFVALSLLWIAGVLLSSLLRRRAA